MSKNLSYSPEFRSEAVKVIHDLAARKGRVTG